MAARIELTQGWSALVDENDLPTVANHNWFVSTVRAGSVCKRYAYTTIDGKNQAMHRLILRCGPQDHVDHQDGDGLNNVRSNIRVCTPSQNMANRAGWGASGFKGVSRKHDRPNKPWRARIKINGREKDLGRFATPEAAARAYDAAAVKLFGAFAWVNYPPVPEQ